MAWAPLLVGFWTCHLGWIPGPSLAGWKDNLTELPGSHSLTPHLGYGTLFMSTPLGEEGT